MRSELDANFPANSAFGYRGFEEEDGVHVLRKKRKSRHARKKYYWLGERAMAAVRSHPAIGRRGTEGTSTISQQL